VWCWNWFVYGDTPDIWTQQGGKATINAYIQSGKLVNEDHKKFWDNQINYYIDVDNRLFVHAGFDLFEGFDYSVKKYLGMRNAYDVHWTRDLAEYNEMTDGYWSANEIQIIHDNMDRFKEIYIGHTAHMTTIFNGPGKRNIWNIDTGSGWGGKLTFMDVDTKEFWQSDNVKTLYPNERGR
jgi:serine/threonine protein phosphatase 1